MKNRSALSIVFVSILAFGISFGGVSCKSETSDEAPAPAATPKTVTITFTSDGQTYKTLLGTFGSALSAPDDPTKTGYDFSGWEPTLPKTFPDKNTTYTAKWTAHAYTVRFDANGGSGEMGDQSFKYGEPKKLSANAFSKSGYEFIGWATSAETAKSYDDKATVSNLTAENNATITLYAKWLKEGDYLITYNLNGGTDGANPDSYNVESDTITLNPATRIGYTFGGWYSDENCTGAAMSQIEKGTSGAITLWAKFTPYTYTIQFDSNGGTGSMESQIFNYDEAKNLFSNAFTKSGYNFSGWARDADSEKVYDDEATISNLTTENNATITLYAKWELKLIGYKVNHYQENIGNSDFSLFESEDMEGYAFAQTVASEKTYDGFTLREAATQKTISDGGDNDINIYYTRNIITVTFDPNGGNWDESTDSVTRSGKYGAAIDVPPSPYKQNYRSYWTYTDADNTTCKVLIWDEKFSSNRTYNAAWFSFNGELNYDNVAYIIPDYKTATEVLIPDYVTSIRSWYKTYPNLSYSNGIFSESTSIKKVIIPDSVTTIGNYAFSGCESLESIDIPSSVTSIGEYAFYECKSLESIDIPTKVTTINQYAFYGCESLESIDIPTKVTTINQYAFHGCKSLKSVDIPRNLTTIASGAFEYCSSLESIHIPENVTTIKAGAFFGCSLKEIYIENIRNLYGFNSDWNRNPCRLYDFEGNEITDITIPDDITEIGSYVFSYFTSLKNITIHNRVTSIGDSAFKCCSSLESIVIPDSVTSIGKNAINHCTSLKNVNIPSNLTSLKQGLFLGCSSLESITIPARVTSIEKWVFGDCDSLTSVHFNNTSNWKYKKSESDTTGTAATFTDDATNALNIRGVRGRAEDWMNYGMFK